MQKSCTPKKQVYRSDFLTILTLIGNSFCDVTIDLSLSEYDLIHSEQFLLCQCIHLQMPGVWSLVQEV